MLNNPMLYKEMMRMRMRQGKPARVAIVSAVAIAIAYFYWVAASYLLNKHNAPNGRDVWTCVTLVQFLIIALLTPSATANAISQEREQQTWEMLLQTRLTSKQIIFGKLGARLVPTLGIIAFGLPVTLLCLFTTWLNYDHSNYGADHALTPGTFLLANGALLITGLFFATFGLYMSMKFKRTLYAMLATYGFVFGVLGIGTMMLTGMLQMFNPNDSRFMEQFPLMWVNPVYIIGELTSSGTSADYVGFAIIGLLGYAAATAFMLSRMVYRFRSMAIDR